ncbi:hypothetical protein AKJ09_06622 [Labilithrix luteola]|uniref:Uncharacterized protein n=1 Tax=Labilithrix luteola TaxID=1391654 RepID=A0A0K1Q2G3_9BACT|nr:hypothetical protein [Labilithrix luteola]AKU99958.1 hypothetical protein AKJ09_06622 [Labilithrix luteola]
MPSPRTAHRTAQWSGSGAFAALIPLAIGALFWLPSLPAAHGFFPAPLDDVYIHFDFARSLAQGHPFEWIPGQGYSSGETSPLYAVLLALGYLIGFRGPLLGLWAAILAVASLALLVRSVQSLVRPCPPWLAWGAALVPFSVGLVDWSFFSGMEAAPFAGALSGALVALDRTRAPHQARGGMTRERAQLRLGLWGAILCLLRPESGVLVALLAVIAARGVSRRSGIAAVLRVAIPGALATAFVLGANRLATGETQSAGAQLKLLSSNPYLSEDDRARAFVENLVTFFVKGVRSELASVRAGSLLVPGLALVGLASRSKRHVTVACLLGAVAWSLLVSWNGNSPFHNFRYYVPALVMVLVATTIGIATIARARRGRAFAAVALMATLGLGSTRFPAQLRYYRNAVANVRDQQVETGERLAKLTPDSARVLLGDAGAIPFVSGRTAIDALGLGGYQHMPFARAAVFGEAATVELIERLDPRERPTHLALYPNWFQAITARFGTEIDRVTIANNVICGGPVKAIYRADWSPLETPHAQAPNVVDEIDVADVLSEAEHAYVSPAPRGGWTAMDVLDDHGARKFDGGRIIPEGAAESFVVRHVPPGGRAKLVVRTDDEAKRIRVHTRASDTELVLGEPRSGAWRSATAVVDLVENERVELHAVGAAFRDFHVWIESP